mmetsp:Transcript_50531/g.134407  ORF Transcript_50531/g.134407 Transcript_50531/m.134407 type:complete len:98 (+) Transcript_50531:203-496(+)
MSRRHTPSKRSQKPGTHVHSSASLPQRLGGDESLPWWAAVLYILHSQRVTRLHFHRFGLCREDDWAGPLSLLIGGFMTEAPAYEVLLPFRTTEARSH